MNSTQQRIKAIRDARTILLAAKNAGGTGLNGAWEYLRDELDHQRGEYDACMVIDVASLEVASRISGGAR